MLPSIDFYEGLGAVPISEWVGMKLEEENLKRFLEMRRPWISQVGCSEEYQEILDSDMIGRQEYYLHGSLTVCSIGIKRRFGFNSVGYVQRKFAWY